MSGVRRLSTHLLAVAVFVALAVVWTWPLAQHLSSEIPGTSGDNLAFLWNDWSMRAALASHHSPFHSDLVFAPIGIDLTLHTHTALSSWLGATLLGRLPVVTAHNLLIVVALALNGIAAYALAWTCTRLHLAAVVAGVIFAGSPYFSAHLLGHVNLLWAWGLPLFTLCLLRTLEARGWRSWLAALGAGVVVVLTAFNDYYYVVYCGAIAVAVLLQVYLRFTWTAVTPRRAVQRLVGMLLAIDIALVGAVVASGGFATTVIGIRIVANRPTNLLAVGWLLLAVLLLGRVRPSLRRAPAAERPALPVWPLTMMTVVIVGGLAPIMARAAALVIAGDYTSPSGSWRSGPAGIDLATVFLGHPWHGVFGGAVRSVYEQFGLNPVEGVGWMGVVPVVLAAMSLVRLRADRDVRLWRWLGVVFFVWALGPWLKIAGADTGLFLPQNVLAHLPILSNARMPGRAMVVVFLALAMLAALAMARLKVAHRAGWGAAVLTLVALDFVPAPFPLTRIETPALYSTLRDLPPGAVCELPLGVRDGFGSLGVLDDRVLAYQMTHGHPLVGGFAARVPASVRTAYAGMPVVRSLLRLSEGRAADPADAQLAASAATAALRQAGVRYLVLNRETASPALTAYVQNSLLVLPLATDGARDLFVISD